MDITLKLSNSILLIYKDKKEKEKLVIEKPMTVNDILIKIGISPILAPMILIDNKRVGRTHIVDKNEMITVIGPLAGG
jgi:sulfur carrier protein ThiS